VDGVVRSPYGTTKCKWDTVIDINELWSITDGSWKPSGVIVLFGQQPFTSMLVSSNYDWFNTLIWKRISRRSFCWLTTARWNAPKIFACFRGGALHHGQPEIWRITPKFDSHEHREKTAKSVSEKCWIRAPSGKTIN
jgi:site-specific DNA-methyltransferase (adenine-specific)